MSDNSTIGSLDDLLAKGVISRREYDAKKRKALGVRTPSRLWRWFSLLLMFGLGFLAAAVAMVNLGPKTQKAETADLDGDGMLRCESGAAAKATARLYESVTFSRNGAPIVVSVGTGKPAPVANLAGIRSCDVELIADGKPFGTAKLWVVMTGARNFITAGSYRFDNGASGAVSFSGSQQFASTSS